MAVQQEEIGPYEQPDYEDTLERGYRFCPTDSEIIVYYLKAKIETEEHPECRLHQVNIYDYNPEELAERYRPSDNKWYFLTPRERKYEKGDRANRITKDSGRWKITQSFAMVYDDVSGLPVGKKNSFVYEYEKDRKTPWLMHEYTMLNPNLPIGSGEDKKKLTDWVICKIYKKETKRSSNNKRTRNQEEENGEQNQRNLDEPSPIRRRFPNPGANQPPNEHENVQIQETDLPSGGSGHVVMGSTQTLPTDQTRTNTKTQQVNTFEELIWTQPPLIDPTASTSNSVAAYEQPDYDTMFTSPPAPMFDLPDDFTSIGFFRDEDSSFNVWDCISFADLDTPLDPNPTSPY